MAGAWCYGLLNYTHFRGLNGIAIRFGRTICQPGSPMPTALIKKYNLTLATGHSTAQEDLMLIRQAHLMLIRQARKFGVVRIIG